MPVTPYLLINIQLFGVCMQPIVDVSLKNLIAGRIVHLLIATFHHFKIKTCLFIDKTE